MAQSQNKEMTPTAAEGDRRPWVAPTAVFMPTSAAQNLFAGVPDAGGLS